MTLLKVENIYKNYLMGKSKVEVLKDINLEIAEGEIVAIIGPSGVGKIIFFRYINMPRLF